MKKPAEELLSREVMDFIIREIEKNSQQEVTFIADVGRDGVASSIDTIAYGNDVSSPVDLMEILHGDLLIHNHPGDEDPDTLLRASEADINLASLLANKKIGFYIVDNQCRFVNVIFKPEQRYYLVEEELESIFNDGGLLSESISRFEPRQEQLQLVQSINESINSSKILISEAGTGTGKSLSYLIPSAIWAVMNKKRVIISTHTINLQQQIAGKDMQIVSDIIKKYLNREVQYAVLIGKSNYLCRYKLSDLMKDRDKQETMLFEEGDNASIREVEIWSRDSVNGTLSEFGKFVRDEIWEELACDSMNCSRKKCPFYSDCFYFKARLEAEKSNIIIVNHSLVFSSIDEESYKSSLPYFSGIVFDEAHHLEDTALKSMAKDLSIQALLYQLRKLQSKRGGKSFGLIPLLERKAGLRAHAWLEISIGKISSLIDALSKGLTDFIVYSQELFKKTTPDSNTIGIDDPFIATPFYRDITSRLSGFFQEISVLSVETNELTSKIKEVSASRDVIDIISTISYRMDNLSDQKNIFDLIFNTANEINFVKWIEITRRNIRFNYSPLEVGNFLALSLFSKKDFTLFTSATLMINKRFDYFSSSIGLHFSSRKERIETEQASPFDYSRQAEIYILEEDLDHGNVTREKTDFVREMSLISNGGVLVLFTSYKRLKEMFSILKDDLCKAGILPFYQGEMPRDELLDKMKKNSNVVLFATSSFWEGIDVQGDNLRCVIIEKLPFDSPGDPVYKAKIALLDSRGANSFLNYSMPRAVLRLKQGMGRLIRSKTDKGVIAILDNRIKIRRYGQIFLNSLPPAAVVMGSIRQILNEAEDFFVNRF